MAETIRVLRVDVGPGLPVVCKLFLKKAREFSVEIMEPAPAASDLLKSGKFDAIISDYQMPGMDGIGF